MNIETTPYIYVHFNLFISLERNFQFSVWGSISSVEFALSHTSSCAEPSCRTFEVRFIPHIARRTEARDFASSERFLGSRVCECVCFRCVHLTQCGMLYAISMRDHKIHSSQQRRRRRLIIKPNSITMVLRQCACDLFCIKLHTIMCVSTQWWCVHYTWRSSVCVRARLRVCSRRKSGRYCFQLCEDKNLNGDSK